VISARRADRDKSAETAVAKHAKKLRDFAELAEAERNIVSRAKTFGTSGRSRV
jgi:hypothetical protein